MQSTTTTREHRFETERLIVNEWHSFARDESPQQELSTVVQEILTERVTQTLPASWQGAYTSARARRWITERDGDGVTLLAIDKTNQHAIGMVILFESNDSANLRLGYMLIESAWGKGFASELIGGFVDWCRQHNILSITAGIERDNVASRRVLEKCGFVAESEISESSDQLFALKLM